jgi:hypothetical protein
MEKHFSQSFFFFKKFFFSIFIRKKLVDGQPSINHFEHLLRRKKTIEKELFLNFKG